MPRRVLKYMRLRDQLLKHKSFLQKLDKVKSKDKIKSIISEATPQEILVLCNLIVAHFDEPQEIKFERKVARKIKTSRYYNFIKKHFDPQKVLPTSAEGRKYLFRIASLIKLFTNNILSSSNIFPK